MHRRSFACKSKFRKFSVVGKNWLDRSSSSTPMRWERMGEGNAAVEAGVGGAAEF